MANSITVSGRYIVFDFVFSYELKDKVKALFPGKMRFNQDGFEKLWICPLTTLKNRSNLLRLREFCEKENFSLDPTIESKISEEEERSVVLNSLSNKDTSEFDVEGLKLSLRPYQKAGAEYMVKAKRAINGDSTRLGKSGQAIASVHHLQAYPCLVVCKAGLMYNWKSEIAKWLDKSSFVTEKIKKGVEADHDFVIVNPEKLTALKDTLQSYNFKSIIYDEAHNCGREKTKKYEALLEISKKIDVRFALTGTPIRNKALEITSILKFLGYLSMWGGKWGLIQKFYEVGEDWSIGEAKDLDILHGELKQVCLVRRTKEDVLKEVPAKNFETVTVELSPSYYREYKRIASEIRKMHTKSGKELEYSDSKGNIFELRKVLGVGKTENIGDWVEEFLDGGEPLVIFAHHIDVQNALIQRFPDCARIIAADSLQTREKNKEDFQSGKRNLIVCSLLAASEGIDLARSNTVAFCELGLTPVQMEQAMSRIEAVGKTDPLFVYTFVAEKTIDLKLVKMLNTKGYESDMVRSGKVLDDSYSQALMESLEDEND